MPVLCIEKKDLILRTEVTFVLDMLQISVDDLVFLDSPSISKLKQVFTKVHLVDHNMYNNSYIKLDSYEVVSIIDHHDDENQQCTGYRHIERVGSCASLVTALFENSSVELSEEMRLFLAAPILLDTVNLDVSKGRCYQLDIDMFEYLSVKNRDSLFHRVEKAKTNISKLSVYDLLRKDYKHFSSTAGPVYIASIFGPSISEYLGMKDIDKDTDKFINDYNANILIVMVRSDKFELFLLIAHGREFITDECLSDITEKLQLVKFIGKCPENWLIFNQLNVKCSRKVVLPLFKRWLEN